MRLAEGGRWGRPRHNCWRDIGWDEEGELENERYGLDVVGLGRVATGWELDKEVKESGALRIESRGGHKE